MVIAYFAAAAGQSARGAARERCKDRVSGKAPRRQASRASQFNFSMATLKKLVEGLKLTRGEEAQSTADKLVQGRLSLARGACHLSWAFA